MKFELDTVASPEQVRAALTDFTSRRLDIWSHTLDPEGYRLIDEGDQWALARENTAHSPFWVVSEYDWSDPATVRWNVVHSSYGGGGRGYVTITARPEGGSHLSVYWDYTGPRRQRLLLFLLHAGPTDRLVRRA